MSPATPAKKSVAVRAAKKAAGPAKRSTTTRRKMAESQQARRAVSNYLDALHAPKQRGRQVSIATLKQRLSAAEAEASNSLGVAKLDALKAVDDLQARLKSASSSSTSDMKSLERAFIKHAKTYSERKKISYSVWRKAGVPAAVLQKAGISRTSA